jgi:hypothetical protein
MHDYAFYILLYPIVQENGCQDTEQERNQQNCAKVNLPQRVKAR